MITIGLAFLAFLAVALIAASALNISSARREMLSQQIDAFVPSAPTEMPVSFDVLRTRRQGLTPSLDRMVQGTSWAEKMALEMQRANLPVRPGEYVAAVVFAAIVSFALAASISRSLLIGIPMPAVTYLAIRFFVSHRQKTRLKEFEAQLPEAIDLVNTSLRAGFGLLQGLETVARDMPRPIKDEFSQVIRDISVGMQFDEALNGIWQRVQSHDAYLLTTSILVHRTVGGNLAEVLTGISDTVRARMRLRDEVRALTTGPRVSSYIVAGLPLLVFVGMTFTNPRYASIFWTTNVGRIMLVAAVCLTGFGLFASNRFVRIDY